MFKIGKCKSCGKDCLWVMGLDCELAEEEVCSHECLMSLTAADMAEEE